MKMLKHYHMHDCKSMNTPVEKNFSLSLDMCLKTLDVKPQKIRIF